MKRWLGVGVGLLLGAVACGGSVETRKQGDIGRSASALVCSAAGSYSVALTGTQQYIYGADYKCSGVVTANETAKVEITPGAVAGQWLVRFGYSATTWTVTEKNGIIDWTFQATILSDATKIGCGWTGYLRLVVDESSITVRHYCRLMSGTSGCTRYSDVTGTMLRDCAPPPPPPPSDPDADSGDPPDPDAGTAADGSSGDASSSPDSSAPPSTPSDALSTGGATASDPAPGSAPPQGTSGGAAAGPPSGTAPEPDFSSTPAACAAASAGAPSSSSTFALAGVIGLALLRRRRTTRA